MTRDDVVSEARWWIDVPYRRKGRSPTGVDCLGLLVVVAARWSIVHEDPQDYMDWPDPDRRILRELRRFLRPVPINGRRDGMIGLFSQEVFPGHTGIFSTKGGQPHLIHARTDANRVVEEYYPIDPNGQPFRLIRMFALPGLED